MNAAAQRMGSMLGAERRVLKGVCAAVADRAGVPVWMPRTAFVVFAVLHLVLAVILYFALAWALCPRTRSGAPRFTPPAPDRSGVRGRFSTLDARLAELEAATLQQEAFLRRQFRDLERR